MIVKTEDACQCPVVFGINVSKE